MTNYVELCIILTKLVGGVNISSYYEALRATKKSTRTVFLKGYWTEDVLLSLVELFPCRAYAYCLHDKDTKINEDGESVPITSHYHILLEFERPQRLASIYNGFLGEKFNVNVQVPSSMKKSFDYLTHKNHVDKFQYSDDNVHTWGDFTSFASTSENKAFEFMCDCLDRMNFYQLVEKYGTFALVHYRHVKEGLHDDLSHDINQSDALLRGLEQKRLELEDEIKFLNVIKEDMKNERI